MGELTTINQILDFAIANEQNAVDLYTDLARRASSASVKEAFLMFAEEERGHKVKLQQVLSGNLMLNSSEKVLDLKISDYTVDVQLGENPEYGEVLLFAMKQEKAAFRLYKDLARRTEDPSIKDLLLGLAQEEAKHKLHFEIEYDEHVLIEN